MAQCYRRTDVLVKEFFFIIYDEDFYKNFRETLVFTGRKGRYEGGPRSTRPDVQMAVVV